MIDVGMWSQIENGDFQWIPSAIIDELREIQIVVPRAERELASILEANERSVGKGEVLYVVVEPTAWCQLHCTYCGQLHSPVSLSPEHQDQLLRRIQDRLDGASYHGLRIGWFGGEPLCGVSIMRLLSARLKALAASRGCSFRADVVTNGLTLTPDVATELVTEMNVQRIEITLDGAGEYHDRRRRTKSGRGTFATILGNVLDLARRTDLRVSLSIRCNVDRNNHDGVSPLLHELADAGIATRISRFYATPVINWGNDAGDRGVSTEQFAKWEVAWLGEMYRLGFRVNVLPTRCAPGCLALNPDAEVVDPFGVVFNCIEMPLVPVGSRNQSFVDMPLLVTNLRSSGPAILGDSRAMGSLAEGVDQRRASFRDFFDRIGSGEYPCGECALFPMCGGACPKKWADGEIPCPAFKYNLSERLLLGYAIKNQIPPPPVSASTSSPLLPESEREPVRL